MESVLIWWSLNWNEMHYPVYSSPMKNETQCMRFIGALSREFQGELLGAFDPETKVCRIVVFGYRLT